MLMALINWWNVDTCMFHLSTGKMTITLEDVHQILWILIRGERVYFLVEWSFQEMKYDIQYCLGGLVHDGMVIPWIDLAMLLYSWAPFLVWIMMFLVVLVLIPDGQGTHLEGGLVHMIRGMAEHRTMGAQHPSTFFLWSWWIIFLEVDNIVHCMLL